MFAAQHPYTCLTVRQHICLVKFICWTLLDKDIPSCFKYICRKPGLSGTRMHLGRLVASCGRPSWLHQPKNEWLQSNHVIHRTTVNYEHKPLVMSAILEKSFLLELLEHFPKLKWVQRIVAICVRVTKNLYPRLNSVYGPSLA
ncbi:hypothetical protein PR048_017950 [Dryococelus australis]|uniref:Uncharacterized protein n=1 Tax=Dryococelus australis TaxID=614101 RepID=A0ABQ9HB19_9NEOP|nr:hypothetical protein PR048_017950 [Dryococelus australis]